MQINLKLSAVAAAVLLAGTTVSAQQYAELDSFFEEAGGLSLLYRGKMAPRYKVVANGNPYWEGPEFKKGSIVFDGRRYDGVMLNFDANSQLVLAATNEGSSLSLSLQGDKVQSFTMEDDTFVHVTGRDDIPDGFYQVIFSGKHAFYKHVSKNIETSFSNVNGKSIGYEDPAYNPNFVKFFHYVPSFYFMDTAGQFTKIKSKSALLKKLPEQKKQMREFLRDNYVPGKQVTIEEYAGTLLRLAER